MLHAETNNDLMYACKILFAHETGFDFDFIKALNPSGLKLAYRKKALETHPDRSKALGRTEEEMNSLFKEVSSAYEILAPFVAGKKIPYKLPKQSPPSPKPRPKKHSFRDRYYHGKIPERKLKIGQFLYYSGRISWKVLIRAIVWQKQHRPLFGQIAMGWNILSSVDIDTILKKKAYNEKFGEYALRNDYFTPFQHMAIMGRQRKLQPLICKYFIINGILTAKEVDASVMDASDHNYHMKYKSRF
jgi:DnaJ domain